MVTRITALADVKGAASMSSLCNALPFAQSFVRNEADQRKLDGCAAYARAQIDRQRSVNKEEKYKQRALRTAAVQSARVHNSVNADIKLMNALRRPQYVGETFNAPVFLRLERPR